MADLLVMERSAEGSCCLTLGSARAPARLGVPSMLAGQCAGSPACSLVRQRLQAAPGSAGAWQSAALGCSPGVA